jgi:hypothetical protein
LDAAPAARGPSALIVQHTICTDMTARTQVHRLQVATNLHQFIEQQVLPGTGVSSAKFWSGFDALVADLAPRNVALLAERDRLQRWTAGTRPIPARSAT